MGALDPPGTLPTVEGVGFGVVLTPLNLVLATGGLLVLNEVLFLLLLVESLPKTPRKFRHIRRLLEESVSGEEASSFIPILRRGTGRKEEGIPSSSIRNGGVSLITGGLCPPRPSQLSIRVRRGTGESKGNREA